MNPKTAAKKDACLAKMLGQSTINNQAMKHLSQQKVLPSPLNWRQLHAQKTMKTPKLSLQTGSPAAADAAFPFCFEAWKGKKDENLKQQYQHQMLLTVTV